MTTPVPARRRAVPDTEALTGASAVCSVLAGLLAEALLEPGDAAAGVEDLLLARVERVAVASTRRCGSTPFFAVDRVMNVLPQPQVTVVSTYVGVDARSSLFWLLAQAVAGSSARRACGAGHVNRNRD